MADNSGYAAYAADGIGEIDMNHSTDSHNAAARMAAYAEKLKLATEQEQKGEEE